jgi:hypothetical protein
MSDGQGGIYLYRSVGSRSSGNALGVWRWRIIEFETVGSEI